MRRSGNSKLKKPLWTKNGRSGGKLSERVQHSWEGGNVKEGWRKKSKREREEEKGKKNYRGNSRAEGKILVSNLP